MDAIQESLNQMMSSFNQRLDTIEGQLPKQAVSSPGSLAAELASFKAFVLLSLRSLQSQIALLANQADALEMRGRRKILLLHGLPEDPKEETAAVVAKAIVTRVKLEGFKADDISRCHRMGRVTGADRPRPILLKLRDVSVRDKIWSSKTNLKGTGYTLSEFLTKTRHAAFLAARQRLGITKCWTREGNVYVLGPGGARHRVNSVSELDEILAKGTVKPGASSVVVKDSSAVSKELSGPSRVRRAVTLKK